MEQNGNQRQPERKSSVNNIKQFLLLREVLGSNARYTVFLLLDFVIILSENILFYWQSTLKIYVEPPSRIDALLIKFPSWGTGWFCRVLSELNKVFAFNMQNIKSSQKGNLKNYRQLYLSVWSVIIQGLTELRVEQALEYIYDFLPELHVTTNDSI